MGICDYGQLSMHMGYLTPPLSLKLGIRASVVIYIVVFIYSMKYYTKETQTVTYIKLYTLTEYC